MTKNQWRTQIKQSLKSMPASMRDMYSEQIWGHLFSHSIWKDSSTILAYAGMNDEVQTNSLYIEVAKSGKTLFLPHIDGREMIYYAIDPGVTKLYTHDLGFLQPPVSQKIYNPTEYPDALLLAPGLAANSRGYRLGRGGGFYDRFLAPKKQLKNKVVVIFENYLCNFLEESHDVDFNFILSERALIKVYPRTCYNDH
ncbi:MAG: 5-formyltetrahydrofolate cyclo-ligase [Spirochaetia bacterium]